MSDAARPDDDIPWQKLQWWTLFAGAAGLALCLLGYVLGAARGGEDGRHLVEKVFFSYLYAYDFCLALALGSMGIWMLHTLTGGAWGALIRRPLEAATRTLPLLAVLFVPVGLGMPYLYLWVDPAQVPDEHLRELLEQKHLWLNVPFFLVRAVIYFAIWLTISWFLNRWAERIDRNGDVAAARNSGIFSGRALVFYGLAITFAAVDWLMSLEPEWYSTIFGVLVLVGQIVPALAFAAGVAAWVSLRTPWGRSLQPEAWIDVGSLMLASVMLWAYISFSQLLLIWSGNLPEEILWYIKRSEGGWQWVAAALALFYFGVPFLLLLSRRLKRQPPRLLAVATLLVAMSVVQQFWLVTPVYARRTTPAQEHAPLTVHWLDLAALVGLFGLWLAVFVWQLRSRPLTPPIDPLLEEAPHYA
jgi:hypothetical protein